MIATTTPDNEFVSVITPGGGVGYESETATSLVNALDVDSRSIKSFINDSNMAATYSAVDDFEIGLEITSGVGDNSVWGTHWHSAPLPLVDYEDFLFGIEVENVPWGIDHDR